MAFSAALTKAEAAHASCENMTNVNLLAKSNYEMIVGTPFKLEHCWEILQNEPKFKNPPVFGALISLDDECGLQPDGGANFWIRTNSSWVVAKVTSSGSFLFVEDSGVVNLQQEIWVNQTLDMLWTKKLCFTRFFDIYDVRVSIRIKFERHIIRLHWTIKVECGSFKCSSSPDDISRFWHSVSSIQWNVVPSSVLHHLMTSLAFGIACPGGRLTRRAISSVVERAPDNCVVVPGL